MAVARVSDGRVQEVWSSREAMADKFHPDFIAALIDVPDHVAVGWYLVDGEWLKVKPKPKPTIDDIKGAAAARIDSIYPLWKQLNIMRGPKFTMDAMTTYIDAVRLASDQLERSLPVDYQDDKYWPVK